METNLKLASIGQLLNIATALIAIDNVVPLRQRVTPRLAAHFFETFGELRTGKIEFHTSSLSPHWTDYHVIMAFRRSFAILGTLATATLAIQAQVIEFESNGLNYQTLTKGGVTIMYAQLPTHIKDYWIIQIAVSNGSPISWTLKPEDFAFERTDGEIVPGSTARSVVTRLMHSGGRNDVIKLVQTYEMSIYGLTRFKSTNGYEQRRQAAFGAVSSTKLKAAAAASAVAFSSTKLPAGQSTDGAVFFEHSGKGLGAGRLVVSAGGEVFRFDMQDEHGQHRLQ